MSHTSHAFNVNRPSLNSQSWYSKLPVILEYRYPQFSSYDLYKVIQKPICVVHMFTSSWQFWQNCYKIWREWEQNSTAHAYYWPSR
jgi:hypothetical protein